jgi:hypothetical protein
MTRRTPTTIQTMQRNISVASGDGAHTVRALNPGGVRQPSLKRMIGLGSVILHSMKVHPGLAEDASMQDEIMQAWRALEVGWKSTRGDQRVVLTQFQETLRAWTAEDAYVADDLAVQRYRQKLHQVLDHGV